MALLAVGAAVDGATGGAISGGIKDFAGSLIGKVNPFSTRPDWFQGAVDGTDPAKIWFPLPTASYTAPIPDAYRSITQIDARELEAALMSAPKGTFGEGQIGTVEGARFALLYGHKELASYLPAGDMRKLANALAYVAHGTYNGDVANWSNRPAGEHAVYLIGDYRKRRSTQQIAQVGVQVASTLGEGAAQAGTAILDAARSSGVNPLHLAIGGGIVLLILLRR